MRVSTDDKMWVPPARVVRGGEDVGKSFEPSGAADHTDDNPKVIAQTIRALQRETRAGFESIAEALKAFARIESRLDVLIDRQNETDRRVADHERRLAALESKGRKPRKK